jgi:glycerophosphoryl diester phosphodiesterase
MDSVHHPDFDTAPMTATLPAMRPPLLRQLHACIVTAGLALCGWTAAHANNHPGTLDGQPPIVIGHRGASADLPEHTLASYELAVHLGADYIEPDLHMTRDGQLVALHDATLERTTDVAERFAARHGGYRVADFSLEEIRSLRVLPQAGVQTRHPDFKPSATHPLRVPTLNEIIRLLRRLEAGGARAIGLYPELKQGGPRSANQLLEILSAGGYTANDKVFIQSFDVDTLRSLQRRQAARGLDYKLVLLSASANQLLELDLAQVASYAQGVGIGVRGDGASRSFIAMAHTAGLAVHGHNFHERQPVAAEAEYRKFMNWGIDGVFSDRPDVAHQARQARTRANVQSMKQRAPR